MVVSVHRWDSLVQTNSQERYVIGWIASSAFRRKVPEEGQIVPRVMLAMKGDVQYVKKCLPTLEKQAELPTQD